MNFDSVWFTVIWLAIGMVVSVLWWHKRKDRTWFHILVAIAVIVVWPRTLLFGWLSKENNL